jgi:uncharacterized protein DUF6496
MKNDPHAYLSRIGISTGKIEIGKGAAKAASASVRTRARTEPPMSTPAPNDRKLAVKQAKMNVSGSTRGKGSLGSMPEAKTGLAGLANIEGNESKKYEAMEKKSLRSMKHGGSEKELRQGHNDGGMIPKSAHAKAKIEKTMHEFKEGNLHSGSKKGPKVGNRKQAIAIALSQARKEK